MKRIGIDARFYSSRSTGVGVHTANLIRCLADLDKKNHYTVFLNTEEYKRFSLPASNFEKEEVKSKHYSFAEQTSYLVQLNSHNFDLMIFPQFNAPFLYRKPYLVTIHDLTLHFFPGKKKKDFISRAAYKFLISRVSHNAKHCFAVSKNTKIDMVNILGVNEDKITVCYNGVSQRFSPITDKQKLKKFKQKYNLSDRYFLYTGVRRSHKNIPGLLKAFHDFISKNPREEIDLVLAGPADSVYTEIPETIKKLNLEDRVQFQGLFSESELAMLISAAEAYVFPSFYEGFGIPPLEAMQCGVPTMVSNTSSMPEVCADASLYFDPHNIKDMSKALERIIHDKDLRSDLVKKGFEQSKKFSWERMAEQMYEVYLRYL